MIRIDPDGLTDFILNRKTGEVTQVGEANDQPDRILKTNRKGKIKRKKNGEPKVAIDGIEKGILRDGMNLKYEDNVFEVGGEGQPSVTGVESFALKLSIYLSVEIGGAYFSKGGSKEITHITIGRYERNTDQKTLSNGITAFNKYAEHREEVRSSLRGFFHTHLDLPGVSKKSREEPSGADLKKKDAALEDNPNLEFYIITLPDWGEKFPQKIPYRDWPSRY